MNTSCEELIAQWLSSSRAQVEPSLLAHVLLYITRNPDAILTIVNILSSTWTQQQDHYKCTDLLAQITINSGEMFTGSSVSAIVDFVCERLPGNHPLIITRFVDIINALLMIPPGSSLYGEHATRICQVLFTHVKTQSLHHEVRYKLLLSLEKMIQNYVLVLRHSEIDFVGGFISLVDGEKDPRNLLKVFELIRIVIANFDISIHVEDLFDYVFCYFPITFTPPPNDPYGITTQQLKDALRRCLAATPYFANYATPLLTEKVITANGSAKSDAIETIGLCAPAYGPHALLPHVTELFDALSKEVYVARSSAMERISLTTIHSVVSTLAGGICIADIRVPVEAAIRSLLDPCIAKLEHPELKDAKSAGHILCEAASAADPTCAVVTHTLVSILTRLFNASDPPVRQKAIIDVFNAVLETNTKLYGASPSTGDDTQQPFQSPLLSFKPQLLYAYMSSINSSDENVRHSTLGGFREMISIQGFLTPEELQVITENLMKLYINEVNPQTRNLALSFFVAASRTAPSIMERTILPAFLDRVTQAVDYTRTLHALETLVIQPRFSYRIIPCLFDKLNYFLGHCDDQKDLTYAHHLTKNILGALKTSMKDKEISQFSQNLIFPVILRECVRSSLQLPESWHLDLKLLDMFAIILATIQRGSNTSFQKASLACTYKLFIDGDLSAIDLQPQDPGVRRQCNLWNSNNGGSVDISIFFPAIVGNARREVESPMADYPTLVERLANLILDSNIQHTQHVSIVKTIAAVANKSNDERMIDTIKSLVQTRIFGAIQSPTSPPWLKSVAWLLSVWIAKAMLIKGHPLGWELVDLLIGQLNAEGPFAYHTATCFSVILQEDDLVLTKASFANTSILYKQRIFYHCTPNLMHRIETASSTGIQINYLCAFSYIIINLPTPIIFSESRRIIAGIIVSLQFLPDAILVTSLLHVTQQIIVPSAISNEIIPADHFRALVSVLLNLSTGHPVSTVRVAALKCLGSFAAGTNNMPLTSVPALLQSVAKQVVKHLLVALDDKKRHVRKEAVACRSNWFGLAG